MSAPKKKQNKLLRYLIIGVVALIIIAVVGKKAGWLGKGDRIKVSTEEVERRMIIETVSASGKIFPEVEVKISSDVSGEIVELFVEEGDSVKKGKLLVSINPDVYEDIVARADAALNSSMANLANTKARRAQVKAQFENAEASYKRNNKLHEDKVISDADFEQVLAAYKGAKAEYDAINETVRGAQFAVKSAEASRNESQKNLKKTTIFSPMDGIVSMLNVEKGERVVGTLQMSGTEIMRIADFENMEARVAVSENDVLHVQKGDEVDIEIDAYLDREFKGVVTQVASSASQTGQLTSEQATNFTVKIRLLNESYKDLIEANHFPFRPGMSAAVEIRTEEVDSVLTVPIQSVTTREEDDENKEKKSRRGRGKKDEQGEKKESKKDKKKEKLDEVVFVYEKGKVEKLIVKTGIQDDTYIEIISGLEVGDEVISAPYSAISRKLDDGDEVEKVDKEDLYEEDED